jgi:hypothetical protein
LKGNLFFKSTVISTKGLHIKKILKIVWTALAAVALSGVIFWLSLFLAWGRVIDVQTGATVAIVIGIIFFVANVLKLINKKETSIEKNHQSFLKKSFNLLIFLLPFFILSFYFIPKFYEWTGTDVELYRYHNFPCENKTFTTTDKVIVYYDTVGLMPKSAYLITHNRLVKNKINPDSTPNKNIVIKKGVKFKVIGFYLPKYRRYAGMYYYLVQSLDENKTKAWVFNFDFDTGECRPEFNNFDTKHFSPKRGTFGEEKINLKNITKQSIQ